MSATRYVLLLRGINVGAHRRIPMPRLREVLTGRGHEGVRTHLASGNVLLDSALPEADLAAAVTAAIAEDFGFDVPVVVRTGGELADVVATDPLRDLVTDDSRYSVTFLPDAPEPRLVAALPPAEEGRYLVRGRELYLWLPTGMARAPMATWPWGRLLGVAGTNRNWNTVSTLADLAR